MIRGKAFSGMFAAAVLLTACGSGDQTAGGEDFPNTVALYGDSILRWVAASANAGAGLDGSTGLEQSFGTAGSSARVQETEVLARMSVAELAADSTWLEFSDTASGVLYVYSLTWLTWGRQLDTIAVAWDAAAKDTIKDNENLLWIHGRRIGYTGNVESYAYWDADGDGVAVLHAACNTNAGEACQIVESESRQTLLNGRTRVLSMTLSCGPDRSFDGDADNGILREIAYTVSASGDTVALEEGLDADGDGWVVRMNQESDRILWRKLSAEPGLPSQYTVAGVLYYPQDTLKNQVFSFLDSVTGVDGSIHSTRLLSSGNDVIAEGDSVVLDRYSVLMSPGGADTVSESLGVLAGPAFTKAGNRLTAWSSETHHSDGSLSSFRLIPDEPIVDGLAPGASWFRMERWDADSQGFWLEGRVDSSGISASWEDQDGNQGQISWDRAGRVR